MNIAAIVLMALASGFLGLYTLHIFQLEGYGLKATLRWTVKNLHRTYLRVGVVCALAGSFLLAWGALPPLAGLAVAVAALFSCAFDSIRKTSGGHLKKKLAYTMRMRRLVGVYACVCALMAVLAVFEPYLLLALAVLYPVFALAAGWIVAPMERHINHRFFVDAKSRLIDRPDLIKIGITGSYGKTSTKFILATILSEKYRVLATPSSFNTPMGLTRVIREQLLPTHEVFIAEMGARHVGDIAELCELVKPTYGAITSVGKQHLETFFTLENIVNTKYELIAALPKDGKAFFADDNGLVRAMYDRTQIPKALSGFGKGLDVYADGITVGPQGSRFTLHASGQAVSCQTPLLGKHNISNVLLCASIALGLGLTLEQVRSGIAKLQPVEHRLQLIKGNAGMTVIDDAFNSNPAGAKAALEVLHDFPGRRVIITPGMVELGEQEEALNREFGRQMASCVDTAILIGEKRTRPILEGLREQNFDPKMAVVVATLDEATQVLAQYAGSGDVVLFENDLPDQY